MKTIGLIGGMSWESSVEYYRIINEVVREKLGGFHSAKSIMVSVDFAEIEALQHQAKWDEAARIIVDAAKRVEAGGADFVILCTNTMHKLAAAIERGIRIPFIHIADPTAGRIKTQGLKRIGLLGTKFTMEEDFYKGRLTRKHGLEVIVPAAEKRERVHRIIYDELCMGQIKDSSKRTYLEIMEGLVEARAQGIILGCTEIGLLVKQEDCRVPLFDTTRIHAEAAVEYALKE